MKRLFLARHAKSDRGNPLLDDIDRPLNDRGYRDAYFMSQRMKKDNFIPDVLISSPAVRAYSTGLIFLKTFGYGTEKLVIDDILYSEDQDAYIEHFHSLNDSQNSIMIFAHNPTISMAAGKLSAQPMADFPTCGICCLDFDVVTWKDLRKGDLRFFIYPKDSNEQ